MEEVLGGRRLPTLGWGPGHPLLGSQPPAPAAAEPVPGPLPAPPVLPPCLPALSQVVPATCLRSSLSPLAPVPVALDLLPLPVCSFSLASFQGPFLRVATFLLPLLLPLCSYGLPVLPSASFLLQFQALSFTASLYLWICLSCCHPLLFSSGLYFSVTNSLPQALSLSPWLPLVSLCLQDPPWPHLPSPFSLLIPWGSLSPQKLPALAGSPQPVPA